MAVTSSLWQGDGQRHLPRTGYVIQHLGFASRDVKVVVLAGSDDGTTKDVVYDTWVASAIRDVSLSLLDGLFRFF